MMTKDSTEKSSHNPKVQLFVSIGFVLLRAKVELFSVDSTKFTPKTSLLPPLSVFLVVLLVYGTTAVPDLTWAFGSGDGGELITAAVSGGIPHPPGYPTYLLLGKLVALLPLEPIAYRFNLFSAVCGALAAAFTSPTAKHLGLRGWLTVLPGLTLAFVPLVWQQAIVTEVYALNLLFASLFLWSLLGKRPSWFTGLLLGVSLTTHLTSALLLPLALLLLPQNQWKQFAFGTLLGLTPFLLLPWLAEADSPVVWGNLNTVAGWWWLVSAQIYRPNQFGLPPEQITPRLVAWASVWLRQLLLVGWLLLLWSGWQEKQRKVWFGLVGTAVAYLTYAFFYNTPDALVLTLPAWLLLSLALAAAYKKLGYWAILLPFASILLNFNLINDAGVQQIRPFAEQILSSSPTNGILITSGDPDIFALWYFHEAEGQRPDLIVVDDQLFAFDWYRARLQKLHPTLIGLAADDLPNFRAVNRLQRPICTVKLSEAGNVLAQKSCVEEP
jgi:Protein O-mannosyl-transferase TMEM260-like